MSDGEYMLKYLLSFASCLPVSPVKKVTKAMILYITASTLQFKKNFFNNNATKVSLPKWLLYRARKNSHLLAIMEM